MWQLSHEAAPVYAPHAVLIQHQQPAATLIAGDVAIDSTLVRV
jgi:hypothetical protein